VQNVLSSSLISKNLNTKIYRSIILPLAPYGCEIWSLTLRGERRLMVFDRVLGRIFASKWNERKRLWRKLHNEELNDLYSSPSIFRVKRLRII